jgi:Ras homolog gene family, member A
MRRKLVIVGDGSCGKTSLLIVAATEQFPNLYIPTVFDSYILNKQIDNTQIELELWDTGK